MGQSEVLSVDSSYRSEDSAAEGKVSLSGDNIAGVGSTKRKYRRHPKVGHHFRIHSYFIQNNFEGFGGFLPRDSQHLA